MSLWKIENNELATIPKTVLSTEERLENWLSKDISIIGLDTLIFGRQVVTEFGGRIDLIGINYDGLIQIIELKRDRTPREIVAQILDYASWVKSIDYVQIDNISKTFLGKDIASAFKDKYGSTIPEKINESHEMIIVASELDDSSERIVQYLSSTYKIGINCIFFNFFKEGNLELLGRSWLMDPEDVSERTESIAKYPWTGYWFYNVGEGDHRNWDDYIKCSFISAGQAEVYNRPMKKLSKEDLFFAYMKGIGYVGYGEVIQEALPLMQYISENFNGKTIQDLQLRAPQMDKNMVDPVNSEWVVRVRWIKTFTRENAKRFTGIFANQNIVCKLRDKPTLEYLQKEFEIKN